MQSDMDSYLLSALTDPVKQQWLKRFKRLRVYMNGSSYPADKAYAAGSWMPKGWCYRDCMVASYTNGTAPAEHYLRDQAGNKLYIRFGAMDQWAADVGNPAFRAAYIAGVKPMAEKCGGVFMDDCNFQMDAVVSNVSGQYVQPWNPRTNAPYTQAQWETGMATFVQEVKAALPNHEVAINAVYFHAGGLANASVKTALAAADVWEFERGFGDTGVVAGTGKYGVETINKFIDYCHSVGTYVCHDVQRADLSKDYVRGCYLLTANGTDVIGHPEMNPSVAWWSGWDINLGKALGPRTIDSTGTQYTRVFEGGTLKVNASARTATIS